ncbi:hypothetical protein HOL21_03365 [Candidatus Woesearchaeota archaeon]|jgi:predicted AlkP superfamily phosphohydrolase/phosphomutase|nr:hypothetical protein [Candidatus Woesearchaeota archaeon]MBT5397225.1 hypothetical protein [Candidatus Woesearchaeota archaeon]MBT5924418.1 hypothetical protein [Candidatus Woesearchaeota archaeon]MBT6367229.1 hypothetical protein [Candidatus Woesearchaeota archaeon]MBT7762625.1 hypothetical protein [Candidatus Woesearchaeota archaeon]
MSKVFVFGIDGAAPRLLFDEWLDDLPTIKRLITTGISAKLNSTIPPSTITAWNSMMSGRDTSELGVFSFTYKDKDGQTQIVNSNTIQCDRVWDILTQHGKKSIVLYNPLTYPVTPINGVMVSGFLALGPDSKSTSSQDITDKIKQFDHPDMFFDVAVGLGRHKALDTGELIKRVYTMTDMQLTLLKDFLINNEWDFFHSVMIGTDRLQHMLWHHFDEGHRKFIKDSLYKDALKNYYKYLDTKLAELITLLPEGTTTIVVSDHGMVGQKGKININNWLIDKGYLVLTDDAKNTIKEGKVRFKFEYVDLSKSKAFGAGAYNARIFLNKNVLDEEYQQFQEKLVEELKSIPDDTGNLLDTKVYTKEVYNNPDHPECPDITVYFDDLRWASNPDLGQEGLYSWQTAVGADSAGHARQGIFIIAGDTVQKQERIADIDIRQVAPTVLQLLDVPIPDTITVKPIILQ